ncbi:syntaxin-2-like isoform X2 [Betta splendens]|uniref:Syntaxin-2-like isoform X2 n=1 Tax=Betta splendens TaxID=158456 RepID=A0A6P7P0V1_BETSP|nr:syntaxin-2-like isoform X2 [Betta splendens]
MAFRKTTTSGVRDADVDEVHRMVVELRKHVEELSLQAERVMTAQRHILNNSLNRRSNDELELQNNEFKKSVDLVQVKLNLMQKNIPVDENGNRPSVIQRIMKNQHSYLTQQFYEVMRGHHSSQMDFRDKCKAQIQRQLEIMDKVVTDEELEEMLNSGNLDVFISDVNIDAQRTSEALNQIESRHQNIVSLESDIKEMHEIFTFTAMMMDSQGGLVNNIERNVMESAQYVHEAQAETKKALAFKKNPYKVASLPNFLKSLRKQSSDKTETE